MIVNQSIWLGGCETPFFIQREDSCEGFKIFSKALVCPICLTVWATLTIQGQPYHHPQAVSCEACWWKDEVIHIVPGALTDDLNIPQWGMDTGLLDALPFDLVRREFELYLRIFET